MSETNLFEDGTFAVVEVMGHNVFAGKISEHVLGGTAFIRVDVPAVPERKTTQYGYETTHPEVPAFTKLIGAGSIYAITPCTEAVALAVAATKRQTPVDVVDLQPKTQRIALAAAADDGEDEDDDGFVEDSDDD